MRRALLTLLLIFTALPASAAPATRAAASIIAQAHVIDAGPSLAALLASRSLRSPAENMDVTIAGGLVRMTWRSHESAPRPALLIEFVAN
jgi:hypothetical protein